MEMKRKAEKNGGRKERERRPAATGKKARGTEERFENGGSEPPFLPSEGFVRLPTVLRILDMKRSTWLEGIKAGKYPRPVRLSPRSLFWRVEDIRTFIASFQPPA